MFQWLKPFSMDLWLMIIITVALAGLITFYLEMADEEMRPYNAHANVRAPKIQSPVRRRPSEDVPDEQRSCRDGLSCAAIVRGMGKHIYCATARFVECGHAEPKGPLGRIFCLVFSFTGEHSLHDDAPRTLTH